VASDSGARQQHPAMGDKTTTIDINDQQQRSEDDMDTDEEPPVTANMLPTSHQPQPPSTQGETFVFTLT